MAKRPPVVLVVLDGWGLSNNRHRNAISLARTPTFQKLLDRYPHGSLITNGQEVGLPVGQMGNSEVGHMNLGAGRVVYQDLTRIDSSIDNGSFFQNEELLAAMKVCSSDQRALHMLGLVSNGGVHSHQRHLHALLNMAATNKVKRVFVHAITDGRDTAPNGAAGFIAQLENAMTHFGVGQIASVSGRYFAMDRDNRWDRTQRAYDAIVSGHGRTAFSAQNLITESYRANASDEFIEPSVVTTSEGAPLGQVSSGDSLVFFNFRADRARQLTQALTVSDFDSFHREILPSIHVTTMTEYDATYDVSVAYGPEVLSATVAEVLAENSLTNLRLAETEKYAHVTYFFNGGEEKPFDGEDRILVPSPSVPTYDLQPEMSAAEITDLLVADISANRHDVVICNFANADMVGHTGQLDATIVAVSTLDLCLARIVKTVEAKGGTVIVTADHGNAEQMWDQERKQPHTAHTTNPVPVLMVSKELEGRGLELRNGSLRDVAPTLLAIAGVTAPTEMTGHDLRNWIQ